MLTVLTADSIYINVYIHVYVYIFIRKYCQHCQHSLGL